MNIQRYNGFAMSHKAMRAMLFSTALNLQHADFSEKTQMEVILNSLQSILNSFDEHADLEDDYILPLAKKYNPELLQAFENEHIKDRRLTSDLNTAISYYRSSINNSERALNGSRIFYALMSFISFNLDHMNREEIEFNSVIWKHYSDEELESVHNKIATTRTPEQKQISGYWMLSSCNIHELSEWLMGIKKTAPHAAYSALLINAQKILTPERWELLEREIEKKSFVQFV